MLRSLGSSLRGRGRTAGWRFVERFYADHGRSPVIRRVLRSVIASIPPDGLAINIGAGSSRLDPRVRNLDLFDGPHVDYVGNAESIPLPDCSVDLVISQETLEHVSDPQQVVREITRVLRPGGMLYLQVPFVIGFHPAPVDYWRFSAQGIVRLAESGGLVCIEQERALGPAVGFYRIWVEFMAILFSGRSTLLYRVTKGAFSVLLYPVKFLDPLLTKSPQADRIAGGFYVLAKKPRTEIRL